MRQNLYAVIAACAACAAPVVPPPAPPPAPPQLVLVEPPPSPPSPPALDPAVEAARKARADDAVTRLARDLEDVEAACTKDWRASEAACKDRGFADLAAQYQEHYGAHADPRQNQGRIDALPRLGGSDATTEIVTRRIDESCVARCDLARRIAITEARDVAVKACAGKQGKAACAALGKKLPADLAERMSFIVPSCEGECDLKKNAAARERSRPKTPAQSHACFRECMKRCTGGRVVPGWDGSYTPDPDEWCGTCDVSCKSDCSIR